ncbi:hypothetical protein NYF20_06055 [Lactobacillus delbrueckii]
MADGLNLLYQWLQKFDQEAASLEEESRQLAQAQDSLPGSFKIPKVWLKKLDKLQTKNANTVCG